MRSAAAVCLAFFALGCVDENLMRARPLIEVAPSALDFGTVGVGSRTTLQITLRNAGTGSLHVTALSVHGTDASSFSVGSVDAIGAGANGVLEVTFAPTSVGLRAATLRIESDADNTQVLDLQLAGRGSLEMADGGATDAGGGDAGTPDSGLPDAGVNDAGQPDAGTPDAGRSDAGMPAIDSGCVGTWRIAPSEAFTMQSEARVLGWFADGGVYVFGVRNSMGSNQASLEVRIDAGAHVLAGATGFCDGFVLHDTLVEQCGTTLRRLDLTTRAWTTGTSPPPMCGNNYAWLRAKGAQRHFSWNGTQTFPLCAYSPSQDNWATTLLPFDSRTVQSFQDDLYAFSNDGTGRVQVWSPEDGGTRTITALQAGTPVRARGAFDFGNRLIVIGCHQCSSNAPWRAYELDTTTGSTILLPLNGAAPTSVADQLFIRWNGYGLAIPRQNEDETDRSMLFDLNAGTWQQLTGDPVDRRSHSVITAGDEGFYSFGGAPFDRAADGGLAEGNLFVLRPPSTHWEPLDHAQLGVPVAGTYIEGAPSLLTVQGANRAYLVSNPQAFFDPTTLTWQAAPLRPMAYAIHGVSDPQGVHVFGPQGTIGGGTLTGSTWTPWPRDGGPPFSTRPPVMVGDEVFVEYRDGPSALYSPSAGTWRSAAGPDAPVRPRSGNIVESAGDAGVFIYGGWNINTRNYYPDGARYDPTSHQWSAVSDAGSPGSIVDMISTWTGQEVLLFGGQRASGTTNELYGYRPATDTWTRLTSPAVSPLTGFYPPAFLSTSSGVLLVAERQFVSLYDRGSDRWRCVAPRPTFPNNTSYAATVVNGKVVIVAYATNPVFWTAVLEGL